MTNELLTRMLDEIERLRGILTREHSQFCAILRQDIECDCGCVTTATSAVLEVAAMRAQVKQLTSMLVHNRCELARLDAALATERTLRCDERVAEANALRELARGSQPDIEIQNTNVAPVEVAA